tara:strand:- start:2308 stop:3891 length:1584 start_codon:yes stop_codon:yes gene_type:complete
MAEPITSPIAGGIRAIRNTVSRSIFTGGGVVRQKDDSVSSNATSRNSALLSSISVQVGNVNQQVVILNKALEVISSTMAVNSALDKQRQAEELRRLRIQGDGNLRDAREQSIEAKIRNTLLSPVKKLGAKLKVGLGALTNAFLIITGGWLASNVVDFIQSMIDGNENLMKQISNKILGGLGILSGGFIFFTTAINGLLRGLRKFSTSVLTFTFNSLIRRPFDFIKNRLGDLIKRIFPRLFPEGAKRGAPAFFKGIFGGGFRNKNNKINPSNPKMSGGFKPGGPTGLEYGVAIALEGYTLLTTDKNPIDSAIDITTGFLASNIGAPIIITGLGITNPWIGIPLSLLLRGGLMSGGYNLREVLGIKSEDLLKMFPDNKKKTDDKEISQAKEIELKYEDNSIGEVSDASVMDTQTRQSLFQGPASDASPSLGIKSGDLIALNSIKEDLNVNSITPKNAKIKNDNIAKNLGSLKEPAPKVLPLPVASLDSSSGGGNIGSGGSGGSVPNIPSANRSNSYVFLAFKNYQVVPA